MDDPNLERVFKRLGELELQMARVNTKLFGEFKTVKYNFESQ